MFEHARFLGDKRTQRVHDIAFDATGDRLVTAGEDRAVIVWDATDLTMMGSIRHLASANSVAFAADGRTGEGRGGQERCRHGEQYRSSHSDAGWPIASPRLSLRRLPPIDKGTGGEPNARVGTAGPTRR